MEELLQVKGLRKTFTLSAKQQKLENKGEGEGGRGWPFLHGI